MVTSLYDIFAEDELAQDNKGVIGYDKSPEVLAQAVELSNRMNEEFAVKFNTGHDPQ